MIRFDPPLPPENPYRAAFEAVCAVPWTADAKGRKTPDLDLAAPAALAKLGRALRAGAETPQVDWGIYHRVPPWELTLHGIAPTLAFVALAHADRLVIADPRAAADLVLDLLAFGRHVGTSYLNGYLKRSWIEQNADNWLSRHLPRFEAATISGIRARLARLPAGDGWRDTLDMEKAFIASLLGAFARLHLPRRAAADRNDGGVRAALAALPETHLLRRFLRGSSGPDSTPEELPDCLVAWTAAAQEVCAYYDAVASSIEAPLRKGTVPPLRRTLSPLAQKLARDMEDIHLRILAGRLRRARLDAALAAACTVLPPAEASDPPTGRPFRPQARDRPNPMKNNAPADDLSREETPAARSKSASRLPRVGCPLS